MISQKERSPARWLFLILVLGLGLRLAGWVWGQGYIHFGQGDGIAAYVVATEYGFGEPQAAYLAQPSYNSHAKLPGPLWALFCLFWCRVWGSIEGAILGIVLLNTAAIYLTYLLAERTLGAAVALWAALLSAISPWVVYFSVSVYNPEMMSCLGALLFLALWQATRSDHARVIFWVPVLLMMMFQFHMSGLMLIPAVILVLWLSSVRLNLPWLLGGILAGVALYFPYIRGDMAHGWENTRGMFAGGGVGHSWEGLKAISAPLSFLVSWAPRWTHTTADYYALGKACFGSVALFLVLNVLSGVVAALMVAGAFLEIKKSAGGFWRAPRATFARSPGILFLALLYAVPVLTAVVSGKSFHTRYCIVLLPAMMPLAAAGIRHWLTLGRLKRLFGMGLVLTCCADVWLMLAMYRFQAQQIDQGPAFIPGFRKLESVYQCLKTHAGAGAFIRIDDAAYINDSALSASLRDDAGLIRVYVQVREREAIALCQPSRIASYRLCLETAAQPADAGVAYRGNGIALVALPASP